MTAAAPLTGFRLFYADPPWSFETHDGRSRTPTQKRFAKARASSSKAVGEKTFREAEDHYPTMSIEEMSALPIAEMAAKDAVLAMWIVGSHCDVAFDLAAAWGFPTFVTDLFYWAKQKLVHANQVDLFTGDIPPPPMSMGYYSRKQVEPCWLFKRGKGVPVAAHDVRQLIIAPRAEHSRKPVEAYERLERMFSAVPRIELFARNTRPGWSAWGNEVGKYDAPSAQIERKIA
ncbi:MT-A70 family methyltransferase [Croceicoccus gelatinilyticus]|uniref:MT-A70 family methyltransferase n=1 Tax=Croceicoccus gelatinilyticus TaxID=2835536 RepID=UPI001BCD02C7|nr:MT-A70 family methyltransferase [Croceicoccus gelatinilyticus]